jgi:hypothetical protein
MAEKRLSQYPGSEAARHHRQPSLVKSCRSFPLNFYRRDRGEINQKRTSKLDLNRPCFFDN